MSKFKLSTKREVENFVRGVSFFGTGGGGNPDIGKKFLFDELEEGIKIEFKDLTEIDDDSLSACAFRMGTIAPETIETKEGRKNYGFAEKVAKNVLINAIKEFEEYMGTKIDVLVPLELGGTNTPGPLDAALRLGKSLVDADYSGRAIPEINQTLVHLHNKKVYPIVAVDEYGDIEIIKNAVSNRMAERFGKTFSEASLGIAGEVGMLLKVSEMKKIAQGGTLSFAYKVGEAIQTAKDMNKPAVEAALKASRGYLLFEGTVTKKEWKNKEGYMWGLHTFKGAGKFQNKTFKIWFKNENHIAWLNDQFYVTSPDLIEVVRKSDSEPITNTNLAEGDEVSIIGMKSKPIFRSKKGLSVLGPRYFGFDTDYRPIESIAKIKVTEEH